MRRPYLRRYNKPRIDRHLGPIAARFGRAAGDVVLMGEPDPAWSEFLLVDDASAVPACVTDDPRRTAGLLTARADVVYVDEEYGVVRFGGPIAGRRPDPGPHAPTAPPSPLPELLHRVGIEPGVWIAVSGRPYGEQEDDTLTLIRVTEAVLERGRELSEAPRWGVDRVRSPLWSS